MNKLWGKIVDEEKVFSDSVIYEIYAKYIKRKDDLSSAVISLLADKLADHIISAKSLSTLFDKLLLAHPYLNEQFAKDIKAYFERDFACNHYSEVLLFFRGYQAVQSYRLTHMLYKNDDFITAKWLQNRIFEVFGLDIHPAAEIGSSLVIDHGTGVVIGKTTKIGDHVFMFHNVTLGGTGKQSGDRHPKISDSVVIGAGATILGNITVGERANIAAGAVVLKDVPPETTVAGIPAQVKGSANKVQ